MNSKLYPEFPQVGDILIFSGAPAFYYPMVMARGEYANKHLIKGNKYVVAKSDVFSSWCGVELVGHEGIMLNYSFFEKKKLAMRDKVKENKL